MSDNIKRHLISGLLTFVSSFLTILGASLATVDPVNITPALAVSLILAAARSAVKVIWERYAIR